MGLSVSEWDDTAWAGTPVVQRSLDYLDYPPLDAQIAAIRARPPLRPWRGASISDALSVPSIFRAVTFISNVIGTLTMQCFQRGVLVPDDLRPRVVVRPNPLTTPREFNRAAGWDMAATGETWLWVAVRDPFTKQALSVVPVPAHEVKVEQNPRDPRFPIITWRGKQMDPRDFRQVVMTRKAGDLRGMGPLQACGAAVSVAVEAQEWAANFFAGGGNPNVIIKSAIPLSEDPDDPEGMTEAERMAAEWMNKPHNLPRVIDPKIEDVTFGEYNPNGAQMLDARNYNNGDAARMFGIPGSLLEHNEPGSSLTYANVGQEFDKWIRTSVIPDYLEPLEQEMSDLLGRDMIVRYNTKALLRADIKTRYEVHGIAIDKGIYDAEHAQQEEGLAPGDVEYAAVPPALPSATPPLVQQRARPSEVRCAGRIVVRGALKPCNRLLGQAVAPYRLTCPRCKTEAVA